MRQAEPERRQAVFLDAGHLAEGPRVTVGQERRIIAESGSAARRPDQGSIDPGLDLFEVEKARKSFRQFDADSSGFIERDEFAAAMRHFHKMPARAPGLVLCGCRGHGTGPGARLPGGPAVCRAGSWNVCLTWKEP